MSFLSLSHRRASARLSGHVPQAFGRIGVCGKSGPKCFFLFDHLLHTITVAYLRIEGACDLEIKVKASVFNDPKRSST